MDKVKGGSSVHYLECTNPRKDIWKVRWDFTDCEDGNAEYYEKEFIGKPSLDDIKQVIVASYNDEANEKILSGFYWRDRQVWLTSENQFNYKACYDAAVMSSGATLPITFKFGSDEEPIYFTFNDLATITDFYQKTLTYLQTTLAEAWAKKDNIDLTKYNDEEVYIAGSEPAESSTQINDGGYCSE